MVIPLSQKPSANDDRKRRTLRSRTLSYGFRVYYIGLAIKVIKPTRAHGDANHKGFSLENPQFPIAFNHIINAFTALSFRTCYLGRPIPIRSAALVLRSDNVSSDTLEVPFACFPGLELPPCAVVIRSFTI